MFKYLLTLILSCTLLLAQAQFNCQQTKAHAHKSTAAGPVLSVQNNAKSDTFNLNHYNLYFDFSDIQNRNLAGKARLHFVAKVNGAQQLNLDLLKLQIDSITQNGQSLSYSYNDTIIRLNLTNSLSINDTSSVVVYYHGSPQGDGTNWGGWHSKSGYYFNLGVGFGANPHTYGRAWFPCFDNFVQKSTYQFRFKTVLPLRPYANGLRQSETTINGDTISTQWKMDEPIPTYLASVAVSNYAEINDTVAALNGVLPIQLMAKKSDSVKILNSFVNLKPTLHALEKAFGPYHWSKVGYATTTTGAMEHATSIHFPVNLVNGTLSGEDILAHELAHHWWGNLITCETDADMWINEGMAEFSSHLYEESVYGRERYLNTVQNNAYFVLENAHTRDNGYKAIQGLTHAYVYGAHVYQKGAMVGHNLRAYLGDSLFFSSLNTLIQNNKYGNLNSNQFRDQLAQISGKNLTPFFDNWVFNPGFPQFAVDSFHVNGNNVAITIGQRLHQAPSLHQGAPVGITFFSATGDTTSRTVLSTAPKTSQQFNLPFSPVFALAAYNGVLLSADAYDEFSIDHNGTYNAEFGKMRITASQVSDTAQLIVMHHYAGSKGKIATGKDYRISKNHYWTVQGLNLSNAQLGGRINFNGNGQRLDKDLLQTSADSLVVLYRVDATQNWGLYPHQQKTAIGTSGFIQITQLQAGEYTLANTHEKVSLAEHRLNKAFSVYPNPATDRITIQFAEATQKNRTITLSDTSGKVLMVKKVKRNSKNIELRLKNIKTSAVTVTIDGHSQPVIITKD